jgi:hypothetical protein
MVKAVNAIAEREFITARNLSGNPYHANSQANKPFNWPKDKQAAILNG